MRGVDPKCLERRQERGVVRLCDYKAMPERPLWIDRQLLGSLGDVLHLARAYPHEFTFWTIGTLSAEPGPWINGGAR